jgi:uncharacterized protein
MTVDSSGAGRISILAGERLMNSPRLYATFLLWLLSELFEALPEVGDPEKPKLVFFFDEAHLLFSDAPKALIAKVEQVARLIRSKGVGVYFITQNPADVPETILGQLGNRVQHALRAFTAKDQKGLKLAAETYRPNPDFAIEDAIRDVGTGEAVTSFLEAKGIPGVAQRTLIRPPSSQVGPISDADRAAVVAGSPVRGSTTRSSTAKALGKSCAPAPMQRLRKRPRPKQPQPKRASSSVPAAMTARPRPRPSRNAAPAGRIRWARSLRKASRASWAASLARR